METDCYLCHSKTVGHLISKFLPGKEKADCFLEAAHFLLNGKQKLDNPYLATQIHRLAKGVLGADDLYLAEKDRANRILLQGYQEWRHRVVSSDNPLFTALQLAVVGNIIDYGAHTAREEDTEGQILELLQNDIVIDHTQRLFHEIVKAKSILYLGDNAGEIVFDKLFIETMNHANVTFAVRGAPIINDVTLADAEQVGLSDVCKVISNGFDAPSTILDSCSIEFVELFNSVDLIISKGQGNFEGLMEVKHPNLFFLLMAKCQPIAKLLEVNVGDLVVKHLN